MRGVGLDIGSQSIKLVELTETAGKVYLKQAGCQPSSPSVAEAVKELMKKTRVSARKVTVSMPGGSVLIRGIEVLAKGGKHKIEQTIGYEAKQQIPFPLEQVFWDWQFLPQPEEEAEGLRRAILVAANKELVGNNLKPLREAGLDTELLEVAPLAIYNCARFNGEIPVDETVMLIDVGAKVTDLVISDERGVFSRSFPLGMRLSELRAARTTEGPQQAPDSDIRELIEEIKRSVGYWRLQRKGQEGESEFKLKKIVVSGGGAASTELLAGLGEEYGVEVKTLNPFRSLGTKRRKPQAAGAKQEIKEKSVYAVATGLALRAVTKCPVEINLLKKTVQQQRSHRLKLTSKAVIMAVVVAGLVFLSITEARRYNLRRQRLQKLTDVIKIYRAYAPKIDALKGDCAALAGRVGLLYNIAANRTLIGLDLLKEINQILPKGLWIEDLFSVLSLEEPQSGSVSIKGKSNSYQELNQFLNSLKSSIHFTGVRPLSSSIEQTDSGEEVVEFTVTLKISSSLGGTAGGE